MNVYLGWMALQTVERDSRVIVNAADLASSNNKDIIHLLHVDDDPTILEISKLILMDMGNFEIDHACCVDEAFKRLATGKYDVVISDYEMPQKDGLQFLKELRDQGNEIPFILFTGKGREEVAIKALNFGSDAYINKQGNPETVYGELSHSIVKTIERKNSKKLLAESESKYLRLFNTAEVGMFRTKLKSSEIIESNDKLLQILGYTREEMQGTLATVYYADAGQRQKLVKILQAKGQLVDFEIKLVSKQGEIKTCLSSSKLYPEQETIEGSIIDVTERKKAERALAESEEKYKNLFENAPDVIVTFDFTGKITSVNKAILQFGFKENDLVGNRIFKLVPMEYTQKMVEGLKNIAAGNSAHNEMEMMTPIGKRSIEYNSNPIWLDGKVVGYQTIIRDTTERKKTEKALVESEANYRDLINGMSESTWVIDFDGNFIDVNDTAIEMLGYSKEELQLLGIKGIDKYLSQEQVKNLMSRIASGKTQVFETVHTAKDGHEIPVEISSKLIIYQRKQAILAIARNITERKKTEQELQEEELKYYNIFNNSEVGIFRTKLDGSEILDFNEKYQSIFGFTREEMQGKQSVTFWVDPLERQEMVRLLMTNGYVKDFECKMVNKQGEIRTCLTSVKLYSKQGMLEGSIIDITERKKAEEKVKFQADLLNQVGQAILMVDNNQIIRFWNNGAEKLYGWTKEQTLGHKVAELLGGALPDSTDQVKQRLMAGESWSTEFSAKKRDGTFVPIILNRTSIFNEKGLFAGAASIATDITAQKETEADLTFSLESLSNSLDKIAELNEKLRVVGSLARHDVRNKLSAVNGYVYLLKKRHSDQVDIVDGLGKIELAVKETSRIFDFAKMYEQLGEEELTFVDVEEKLKEAVALFSGSIPTVMDECRGLKVLADSFLRQMFFNLIDNTIKYGKKTTTIKVHFERADQDCLKLVYEDDGDGVPTENKPRLFSEGFSTGGNTGFGLFLTKKMMDVYGWQIQENGTPGKGAKFTITIPKINKNGKENYKIAQ